MVGAPPDSVIVVVLGRLVVYVPAPSVIEGVAAVNV
jgi:hypothetical protein